MIAHPIEGVMRTAMENLKAMVDVKTIVGDPVTTPDGTVIVPISRVNFGFAAGGSDFGAPQGKPRTKTGLYGIEETEPSGPQKENNASFPFGGGSGGGVSIVPIAFLVVGTQGVKIVPLESPHRFMERLVDMAPHMLDKITTMFHASTENKKMPSPAGDPFASSPLPTPPPPTHM